MTPWTVACRAPLLMGFSSQEYWNGLPCLPPWDLPDPGIEPWILDPVSCLLCWQVGSLPLAQPGKPSLLSFRLNFPGKMIYPLIPSSRHSHYSRSPPFCWWWYITKSNWHLLSSFLNFTFIKFSLNDSCFYVPNTVWKVIEVLWIKEKTSVNVFVFLPFPLILQFCQKTNHTHKNYLFQPYPCLSFLNLNKPAWGYSLPFLLML